MPKKKKGPPYTDDPGCKYIVVEDPWPGTATGKARNQVYFNHLCTWVYFMLGKAFEVEAVYSVNTRNEVIVQLPQAVDLGPILGAHPWRRFLQHGDPRDKDRVSYVFEYDYRNRGEPGNHNWLETFPTVSGDPPPHLRFPVVFPYPHVSWGSPKGKNCADLALPLPPTRQPTPVPDTSLFAPYQHPSQLTATTVDNAHASEEDDAQSEQKPIVMPPGAGKIGKIDPYEADMHALRSLKQELHDEHSPVKKEAGVHVKPELYGPSKAFRNAIEHVQQARANAEDGSARPSRAVVKPEDEPPPPPSSSFIEAFNRIRGGQVDTQTGPRIKEDVPDELPPAPSEQFKAAFERIRGDRPVQTASSQERAMVKSEPGTASLAPLNEGSAMKSEPGESPLHPVSRRGPRPGPATDPRLANKRVKEEDSQEPSGRKRVKSEYI